MRLLNLKKLTVSRQKPNITVKVKNQRQRRKVMKGQITLLVARRKVPLMVNSSQPEAQATVEVRQVVPKMQQATQDHQLSLLQIQIKDQQREVKMVHMLWMVRMFCQGMTAAGGQRKLHQAVVIRQVVLKTHQVMVKGNINQVNIGKAAHVIVKLN